MLLEGLHIPLTTPFHSDGRLNSPKLAANIARYSKTPAAGLILLAPNGEPTLLSDEETREVLTTAASAAAPEKVLIAGIARDSVPATLDLAAFTATLDYDAILIGPPSLHLSDRETLTYFQTIADRSPLPIVLSNTASRRIPMDLIVSLAAHPNIRAILDAASSGPDIESILHRTASVRHEVTVTIVFAAVTARMKKASAQSQTSNAFISAESLTENATGLLDAGDIGASIALIAAPPLPSPNPASTNATNLRTRTKTVGFQVLAGSTASMIEALRAGACGIAPAFAACAPQACYEVFAAWKDNDQPLAEEKQARLREAADLIASLGPGALRLACDVNGYYGGLPRLPHLPPTGEQRAAIERLLAPMRN